MIAGVLVGCVIAMQFLRSCGSLHAARVAAFFAVGISVGGSMTYGQTVGLTQNDVLIGNWQALRWGYLGLFIKGGLWIGIASALMATQLGRIRYGSTELSLLLFALVPVWFCGVYFLNEPFDPEARVLPKIYFSASWDWEPTAELVPRREVWGGLTVAFCSLIGYARFARHDRLTLRLGLWGFLAGGLGFANGQLLAAASSWNPDWLVNAVPLSAWETLIESFLPYMNWWNMMEISFGTIFGAVLALGLWVNRSLFDTDLPTASQPIPAKPLNRSLPRELPDIPPAAELALAAIFLIAVLTQNCVDFGAFDRFSDQALTLLVTPLVAVSATRWWPYFVLLPLTLLPNAGKTIRQLVYRESIVTEPIGWVAYGVLPVAIAVVFAIALKRRSDTQPSGSFAAVTLLSATWLYFGLNFAFFHYPWPWSEWTMRTPSGIIMAVDTLGLTIACVFCLTDSSRKA